MRLLIVSLMITQRHLYNQDILEVLSMATTVADVLVLQIVKVSTFPSISDTCSTIASTQMVCDISNGWAYGLLTRAYSRSSRTVGKCGAPSSKMPALTYS